MSDFDSSFEGRSLAQLFRPRMVSDPNAKGLDRLLRPSGPRRPSGLGAKARLGRVVSRAPEVMVKVTGRPKGKNHVAAHFDYIGRKGELALERRGGDILADRETRNEVAGMWGDPVYWRDNATTAAVSMIFSMPQGTDPAKVLASVRAVAQTEIEDEWDYVMALHTDTPRPHVHLAVAARGDTGRRFNPRPHTLHHFRERFAEELRARGVTAEATPRAARGIGRAGQSMALHQMRQRLRAGTAMQPRANRQFRAAVIDDHQRKTPPPPFVKRSQDSWAEARRIYLAAADQLAGSGDPDDRKLADQVRAFVRGGRTPTAHEQALAAIERSGERQRQPERRPKPPDRTR
ncbi:relaxase/mobilization nuclease domain-containing protein [Novosphingobium sp. RD2P27]|uniref:Relaxase/mobilization nuclease domain-containing protein n=1 Tax=Novosphingobium kalidii TaxID=3230299 RepID=A0ABV2D3R3_9SPHN